MRTRYVPVAAALLTQLLASLADAHEATDAHDDTIAAGTHSAQPAPQLPTGLLLPSIDGPKPWSDKPVLNDPDRFQIAIMTDRTGGHRPGIWMDAVRKLNMLRPEFVMSVGDLIEGYTDDRQQAEREWREFLGFIDRMQMRFFFVAGNHDVTNPLLHRMWREKFGREWYSFDYRRVHFLCLCSEDPETRIGDEQLAFVRSDLAEHAAARHTLVFLHKPLWTYAERSLASSGTDHTNWSQVEELLADRPHTVFAGHVHHYVQYERNGGRNYYSLATTGGGSELRGTQYGEFDHLTWLTMEPDGPHVVNLLLDGIIPPDAVTEESANRFGQFLASTSVEVAPILIDEKQGFSEGEIHLRLHNQFGEDVELTGRIDGLPLRGLTVDPERLKMAVGPTGVSELSVRVVFGEAIHFDRLAHTTLIAKLRTTGADPLSAERIVPVLIDRRHNCALVAEAPAIDGHVEPWTEMGYRTPDNPHVIDTANTWQGNNDGSFAFTTSHNKNQLFLAARVIDERVTPADSLEFLVDGRPLSARMEDPQLRRGTMRISVAAPDESGEVTVNSGRKGGNRRFLQNVTAAGRRTAAGYEIEIAMPLDRIKRLQGENWHSFQMAAVQHDVDEPDGDEAQILWRGTTEMHDRNTNFGHFVRANVD